MNWEGTETRKRERSVVVSLAKESHVAAFVGVEDVKELLNFGWDLLDSSGAVVFDEVVPNFFILGVEIKVLDNGLFLDWEDVALLQAVGFGAAEFSLKKIWTFDLINVKLTLKISMTSDVSNFPSLKSPTVSDLITASSSMYR
ncbi:hypothetical protein GCK72_025756 [Caenorhabditis remanei]|uniref:Uncharacterized protein n=1 Tax=Caenorhabditis remanei TaxID=31234 RepID=A0A6A5G466_CAERE|nr:hypothetical protein GCK72_025756 [Caenorhabditis remanei]KAF1749289.1 hypothetical protein GCK72_025756 [Caenorhabditis remanei]